MRQSMDRANAKTEYEMCKNPSPEGVPSLGSVHPPSALPFSYIKRQRFAVGECDCSYVHGRRSLTNCFVQATFERDIKSSFVAVLQHIVGRHEVVSVFM